jgi:hypothetical protein
MKVFVVTIILLTFSQCDSDSRASCSKKFFECAQTCSLICEKTISHSHEYGKCFSICCDPCRKEYCKTKLNK